MEAALRILSFGRRTAAAMECRLLEKGFARDVVGRVCRRLRELGYINDRQFACEWIREYSGAKCRSPWVLKRELRKRGIDAALAEEMVGRQIKEADLFTAACELVGQRVMRAGDQDGKKLRARMQNLLLRRGFDYDFARRVLAAAMPPGRIIEDTEE